MRHFLIAVLCVLIPATAVANDGSYKVAYDGGSISEAKTGTSAQLFIEADQIRLAKGKQS